MQDSPQLGTAGEQQLQSFPSAAPAPLLGLRRLHGEIETLVGAAGRSPDCPAGHLSREATPASPSADMKKRCIRQLRAVRGRAGVSFWDNAMPWRCRRGLGPAPLDPDLSDLVQDYRRNREGPWPFF